MTELVEVKDKYGIIKIKEVDVAMNENKMSALRSLFKNSRASDIFT